MNTSEVQTLHTMYAKDVLQYCLANSDSREDAEDAAQDTWLRVLEASAPGIQSRKGFVLAIARSVLVDRARYLSAEKRNPEGYTEHGFDASDPLAELTPDITRDLSEEEIRILTYRVQGYTTKEAADAMGVNHATLRSRLRAVIKKIQEGSGE